MENKTTTEEISTQPVDYPADYDYYEDLNKRLSNYVSEADKKEEKFIQKYGIIRLYLIKRKLNKYIAKKKKHSKELLKYNNLYDKLSLAITAGFSSIKEHEEYLKEISKKVEEKNGNN